MREGEKENPHGEHVEMQLFEQSYQRAWLKELFFVASVVFDDRGWSKAHAVEVKASVRQPEKKRVHEKTPDNGFEEAIAGPLTRDHEAQGLLPFSK